jgi:hypothetical protein
MREPGLMDAPDIVAALDARTASRIKQYSHPLNRASEAGHPCVRFLVLSRIATDLKTLHDVGLQRIFDLGNVLEDAVLRDLSETEYKVIEQQRGYSWPKFQLSGRIDAKVGVNGSFLPLEIKSCSPNVFRAVINMAPGDMVTSKYPWVRKYPAQILLYMLMEGSEAGIMLFFNKTTAEKCKKLFILDSPMMEYAESILKKLEAVNEWVRKNEAPPAERCADCEGCGFAKTSCFVGQDYGPGFELVMDAGELELKLERREVLLPAAKEFDELDEEIKGQFKGKSAIVGDWRIESKPSERKEYTVPAQTIYKTSIERI